MECGTHEIYWWRIPACIPSTGFLLWCGCAMRWNSGWYGNWNSRLLRLIGHITGKPKSFSRTEGLSQSPSHSLLPRYLRRCKLSRGVCTCPEASSGKWRSSGWKANSIPCHKGAGNRNTWIPHSDSWMWRRRWQTIVDNISSSARWCMALPPAKENPLHREAYWLRWSEVR